MREILYICEQSTNCVALDCGHKTPHTRRDQCDEERCEASECPVNECYCNPYKVLVTTEWDN